MSLPATYNDLYAGALLRKAELTERILALLAEGQDPTPLVLAQLDLHFGLEEVAQLSSAQAQADGQGYLQETYGLLSLAHDPLLRPWLPPIPPVGGGIVYEVLGLDEHTAITIDGAFITLGASLSYSAS